MSDVQQRLGRAAFVPHPWPHIPLDGHGRVKRAKTLKPKRVAKRGRRTVKTL